MFGFRTTEVKSDESFEGSIYEKLGLSKYLCPICGAHLKETREGDLICLNACHLPQHFQKRMSNMLKAIAVERETKALHQLRRESGVVEEKKEKAELLDKEPRESKK